MTRDGSADVVLDLTLPGPVLGVQVATGRPVSGSPLAWARTGRAANPAVLVSGAGGSGRTTLAAVWALRLAAHGVRTLVAADPTGSYAGLAAVCGVEPLRLGPGYPARVNVLDAPADQAGPQHAGRVEARRLQVLASLVEAVAGRECHASARLALTAALRDATGQADGATVLRTPTLRGVLVRLRDPSVAMVEQCLVGGVDVLRLLGSQVGAVEELRWRAASAADALSALLAADGPLGGFDGPTNVTLDAAEAVQVVDVGAVAAAHAAVRGGPEAVGVAQAAVASWSTGAVRDGADGGPGLAPRMVVRDDWWHASFGQPALLDRPGRGGVPQVGLQQAQLLTTFELADACEVPGGPRTLGLFGSRVLLGQDTFELAADPSRYGLTTAEVQALAGVRHPAGQGLPSGRGLAAGRGVWQIGAGSDLVEVDASTAELNVADRSFDGADAQTNNPRTGP